MAERYERRGRERGRDGGTLERRGTRAFERMSLGPDEGEIWVREAD